VASDFDAAYADVIGELQTHDRSEEKAEYLAGCQSDLQAGCTLMQQSNELALKARISEVSPYLLLFRNDRRFGVRPEDIDFSDLRTLDAQDLPRAVNAFCTKQLSEAFVADYEAIRFLRNKIVHLGSVDRQFDPEALLKIMVRQFIELWPERRWLAEYLSFARSSRYAVFHDGKYSSAEGEVFANLKESLARFSKAQFKQLLGYDKKSRRYLCPICIYNSEAPRAGMDLDDCKTAFLKEDGTGIFCVMCQQTTAVSRHPDCKGDVIGNGTDIEGMCLTCCEWA
jgi:hypothetical protein